MYVAYVIVYEIPGSSVNWKTVLGGGEKSTVGKCLDDLLRVLTEKLSAVMGNCAFVCLRMCGLMLRVAPKKTEDEGIEREVEELYGVKGGPIGAGRGRYM
jgi:RNA:NAD 2'-phosphotransferase (TPT1/KptA family)